MGRNVSTADRCIACAVALLSLLMCAGVRYVFHLPLQSPLAAVSAPERPYMP